MSARRLLFSLMGILSAFRAITQSVDCGAGTFISGSSCEVCAAGTYTASTNELSCSGCAVGTYSNIGATACTACTAGTYTAVVGSSSCVSCSAGRYGPATGATSCATCAVTTYSAGGASACSKCPGGKFGTTTGAASCANCQENTYSGSGKTSCKACPVGYHAAPGSPSCTLIPGASFPSSVAAILVLIAVTLIYLAYWHGSQVGRLQEDPWTIQGFISPCKRGKVHGRNMFDVARFEHEKRLVEEIEGGLERPI